MKIVGEDAAAEKAHRVLDSAYGTCHDVEIRLQEQNVDYAISLVFEDQEEGIVEIDRDLICHTSAGKTDQA